MIRVLLLMLGLSLLCLGCSARCGAGTQKAQADNGDIVCVPVTVARGTTQCDADAGVQLIDGNRCVAAIQCGAGTHFDPTSHQCLGVAQSAHDPPLCTPPTAGHICVNGTLRNLVDGSFLSGETLTVSLYDATNFLGNPTPTPLAEALATDTFLFASVPTPGMYILIVTHDTSGAPATYQATGIGTQVSDGQSVRVDGYVISKLQYAAWSLPGSFMTQGALLYRFFNDPPAPAIMRTPTETHSVAGVTLLDANTMAASPDAHYFGASLAAIDGSATVTSAIGGAITTAASSLATFTGKGGGVTTWEAHQALPIPNVVQVDFFHPQ